jgi:hypothetical protein
LDRILRGYKKRKIKIFNLFSPETPRKKVNSIIVVQTDDKDAEGVTKNEKENL